MQKMKTKENMSLLMIAKSQFQILVTSTKHSFQECGVTHNLDMPQATSNGRA